MSHNTYAAQINISTINYGLVTRQLNGGAWGSPSFVTTPTSMPVTILFVNNINSYRAQTINVSANVPSPTTGKYITASLNGAIGYNQTMFGGRCSGLSGYIRPENVSIKSYNDSISCEISDSGTVLNFQIISYIELNSESTPTTFQFAISNPSNYLFSCSNAPGSMDVICSNNTSWRLVSLSLDWNNQRDPNTAFLNQITQQNQIIINQNQQMIDQENQSVSNIENQTVSDISGAENQATTNLIGVLTGFINAFSNINATNCQMTLQFPNYAGGTRVVDICQGKEKAPRIVEIGSSLLLIGVFVPLAYILIKMIYNEIRSWTNG